MLQSQHRLAYGQNLLFLIALGLSSRHGKTRFEYGRQLGNNSDEARHAASDRTPANELVAAINSQE